MDNNKVGYSFKMVFQNIFTNVFSNFSNSLFKFLGKKKETSVLFGFSDSIQVHNNNEQFTDQIFHKIIFKVINGKPLKCLSHCYF